MRRMAQIQAAIDVLLRSERRDDKSLAKLDRLQQQLAEQKRKAV